jgi:hypothetical protein
MGKESVNVGVIGCLMFDGVAGSVGESGAKKLWSLAFRHFRPVCHSLSL